MGQVGWALSGDAQQPTSTSSEFIIYSGNMIWHFSGEEEWQCNSQEQEEPVTPSLW
jgi:hypothetical protein